MKKTEGRKSRATVPLNGKPLTFNSFCLKGKSHEIFDPRFFALNVTPGCADSWAKAVLNIDSNSRRNSIRFNIENLVDVFCYVMPNLKFYFTVLP
jgi:hypothetical protein